MSEYVYVISDSNIFQKNALSRPTFLAGFWCVSFKKGVKASGWKVSNCINLFMYEKKAWHNKRKEQKEITNKKNGFVNRRSINFFYRLIWGFMLIKYV